MEYEYYLPDQFDDYTLLTTIDEPEGKTYVYMSIQGNLLQFSFTYGNKTSLYVDAENSDIYSGTVDEQPADIYISKVPDTASVIVWNDPQSGALLVLSAYADRNTLPILAKKVEKRIIPSN